MGRDPFPQPRVLRAPSSLALNPAREGAATAPLGSLGQGLTTLRGKSFFLRCDLNLPAFSLKPSPLVLSLQARVWSLQQCSGACVGLNTICQDWGKGAAGAARGW